jgi:hypothetical protein
MHGDIAQQGLASLSSLLAAKESSQQRERSLWWWLLLLLLLLLWYYIVADMVCRDSDPCACPGKVARGFMFRWLEGEGVVVL